MRHCTEDELVLYHYGEARRPGRIVAHLEACDACAALHREIAATLAVVSAPDVPERDERYGLEMWQRIRQDLPPMAAGWSLPLLAWRRHAFAGAMAVLLASAFAAGRLWPSEPRPAPGPGEAPAIAELRQELREMRQMLTLSLLQQQSATERLRGVSGSLDIDRPSAEIVRALLDALMHDPNVNVRLASVEALRRFSQEDIVRKRTVEALQQPDFPLVQIALIDLIVETKDTGALGALRSLADDAGANEAVRGRAAWGIGQLSS